MAAHEARDAAREGIQEDSSPHRKDQRRPERREDEERKRHDRYRRRGDHDSVDAEGHFSRFGLSHEARWVTRAFARGPGGMSAWSLAGEAWSLSRLLTTWPQLLQQAQRTREHPAARASKSREGQERRW